jgi:hypothetical protein
VSVSSSSSLRLPDNILDQAKSLDYKAYWLDASSTDATGNFVDAKYKAYRYDDNVAFWSIKRPLDSLLAARSVKFKAMKELKQQLIHFEVFLHLHGLEWDNLHAPSMQQLKATADIDSAVGSRTREEPTISTLGLLLWHVWWVTCRRALGDRRRAKSMLLGLLGRCWKGRTFRQEPVLDALADLGQYCTERLPSGSCLHLHSVVDTHIGESPQLTLVALVDLSAALAKQYVHCPACAKALRAICEHLTACIEDAMPDLGLDDKPLRHADALAARGKRSRVDEDYKKALTLRITKKRRCHGKAAFVDIEGLSKWAPASWDMDELISYQRACWRTLGEEAGVFCMQHDGARLGQPGKEVVVMSLQHNASGVACYLPPQVFSLKIGGK